MPAGGEIALSKHHGAGNDFLVFPDLSGRRDFTAAEVRALCDRHRGVGADGLIRVLAGREGATLAMDLRNADGTEAQMSGNGIRCLVQAAVESGAVAEGTVKVHTLAGIRTVDFETTGPGLGRAAVDMGPVYLGSEVDLEVEGLEKARLADVGNPHLVLLCSSLRDETVRIEGARLQGLVDGGVNVEFVSRGDAAAGPGVISVRVYERGVGETLACGTGACAAAAAARSWGVAGDVVDVSLPGGKLEVDMRGPEVTLRGTVRRIARVQVSESDLAGLVADLAEGAALRASKRSAPQPVVGRL